MYHEWLVCILCLIDICDEEEQESKEEGAREFGEPPIGGGASWLRGGPQVGPWNFQSESKNFRAAATL